MQHAGPPGQSLGTPDIPYCPSVFLLFEELNYFLTFFFYYYYFALSDKNQNRHALRISQLPVARSHLFQFTRVCFNFHMVNVSKPSLIIRQPQGNMNPLCIQQHVGVELSQLFNHIKRIN